GLGRGSRVDPRVSGKDLQQKAPAFRTRLYAAGPLRTTSKGCRYAAAFYMSFPRHREIYRPMWSSSWQSLGTTTAAAPTHRLDEVPAGYSLASCAPAELPSASPAGNQYALQSFCRSRVFQRTANSVLNVCVSPGGKRSLAHAARSSMVSWSRRCSA